MPFKLVTIVENSLSLGSILLTDGVHVVSIDTITNKDIKAEPVHDPMKLLPKHMPKSSPHTGPKFKHPQNKTSSDFVIEYLEQYKVGTWKDLRAFVSEQGFAKSSINNGIARLIKMGRIKRVAAGKYGLIPAKKTSE